MGADTAATLPLDSVEVQGPGAWAFNKQRILLGV